MALLSPQNVEPLDASQDDDREIAVGPRDCEATLSFEIELARCRIGVVKLLRARGGCLGVIRKSGVEGCDISGGAAQRALIPEYPSKTRGTETSQYPEEKKATATPSVAASERGPA